jgi:arginine N-succinyltransferase
MPRYPVYLDLLPKEAQDAVGMTHRDTMPARKMLEAEGLRYENHVDIFDAGPVLECHIVDLRTVRESVLATVRIGARVAHEAARCLVSNTSLEDFRCGASLGAPTDGVFVLSSAEAAALHVAEGDAVRVLASQPRTLK